MHMKWRPVADLDIPLYQQISAHIKEMIKYGYYRAGVRLSERALAEDYEVSRSTIAEAFNELKRAGFLETIPRSGTVVSKNAWCLTSASQTPDWHSFVKSGSHAANRKVWDSVLSNATNNSNIKLASYSLAENPFNPYEPLVQAMRTISSHQENAAIFSELHPCGRPELRQALAEYMRHYGINANPDNIIVFNGCLEAVNVIHQALLHAGVNYYSAANDMIFSSSNVTSMGVNKYKIAMDSQGIDVNDLMRKVNRKNMNVLYLNTVNHFPTGITYSAERRAEILDTCRKLQLPIIENDMMRDIWIKEPPLPLKASDDYDQIIYVGSFSTLSLSGLKIAWALLPQSVIKRVRDVKIQLTGTIGGVTELLAYTMLTDGSYMKSIERIRKLLPDWIDDIDKLMNKHFNGIAEWDKKIINYHAWIKFDTKIGTQKLAMNCPEYYFIPGATYTHAPSSYILINSLSNPMDVMDKGFEHIANTARTLFKI